MGVYWDTFPVFVCTQVGSNTIAINQLVSNNLIVAHNFSTSITPVVVSFALDFRRGRNPPASKNPTSSPSRDFDGRTNDGILL